SPRILLLNETFFEISPVEGQLLQLALTTAIADGTVKRMVGEQELEHRPLGLLDFFALRRDDHAVSADDRAGGLELRHLLNAYQAHAAGCLQSQIGVIAE